MPAMLIYSIFMLVESTIMLNTMLTVVAKNKKKQAMAMADLGSDSPIAVTLSELGLPVLTWSLLM